MKKSYKLSKKIKKNSSLDSDNNLILVYKENKKLFDQLNKIKKEEKLESKKFVQVIKENILIPISIFKNSSPLESLVKYLKENIGLSLHEIASLLKRDERTIWTTYNNALNKNISLDASSKVVIPVNIFEDRKLSVFENLISYLINEEHFEMNELSRLLNRDYKTVWTCYNRAKVKENEKLT